MMDENIFKNHPLKLVGSLFVCLLGEIYGQALLSVNHVLLLGTHPQCINQRKEIDMQMSTFLRGLFLYTICV